MQKVIAWNSGSGNITLTYTGQGDDTVTVASDANNLTTSRSQIVTFKTTDNSITRQVTVQQGGMQANIVNVSASANLSANGTNTGYGSLMWNAPSSIPYGSTILSITLKVEYSWSGKGNIRYVTINNTNVSPDTYTEISLPTNTTTSLSISCSGSNKNATGNHFTWSTLTVTYEYT